jgi:replicative DNA helicase
MNPSTPIKLDRLPPHSPEAEQGVLGCVLLSPRECMAEVAARLESKKEAFYDLRHQTIFTALLALQDAGKEIDIIILQGWLKDQGVLEQVSGIAYLAQLQDAVPSTANLSYYLDIVCEKWRLRRMIKVCTETVGQIYDFEGNVEELTDMVQHDILNLPRGDDVGGKPLSAYAERLLERADNFARGIGMITGLPTGYRYWDRLFAGMHATEVVVIGGRPGTGKTSLAMNVVERVAMDGHNPVGVLSMEMSAEDLIMRLVCSRARVNFHKLRTGCPTADELDRFKKMLPQVMNTEKCPIFIDDTSGLTIYNIKSRLRVMRQRYKIRLAVVDYLQLAALSAEWRGNPVAGYGEVAKGIQALAKELGIPIMLLSQLSREGEKRGTKPRMSDLRESGDIEGVANFIGILWRSPLPKEEETKMREEIANDPMGNHEYATQMEVCKNKNGPSGTAVGFNFKRWCMRFEDLQYESPEQHPLIGDEDVPEEIKS